jgi:hypothetical protein
MKIFYRENKLFKIDKSQLNSVNTTTEVINSLYAAVYTEFAGASDNPKYRKLNHAQRMNKLNEFAENWLKKKGLL